VGRGTNEERLARPPGGVLIAESDPALGELYRSTLAADGWHVDVVANSASMMERVHRAPPAVLLLSTVPDADQLSLVEQVRSVPGIEAMIIIVLFDTLDRIDTSRLSHLKVQAWLSKTRITRDKLSQTIATLVHNAPHSQQ
jgi:DNA-binding response OmpR family regulator